MTARHLGLTWDHPRGYRALTAAAREIAPAGLLHWDRQPLEGFESQPIGELATQYDLLVLDHPHIGEAVALDCLVPLDEVFSGDEIDAWGRDTIGPALASYVWQSRLWALPLDVATQVSARRPDLLPDAPATWQEVMSASRRHPVALCMAGPHAALAFFSLLLSLGCEPGGDDLADEAKAVEVLEMMAELDGRAPPFSRALNPIGLLDAMAQEAPLALVPLVYGYVNYTVPSPGQQAVAFTDAPAGPAGRRGSVLGGTGIALTRRARLDRELLEHLRWLLGNDAQIGFIPSHDGQPSLRAAWQDSGVNERWADFYRLTTPTTESAWVRPRHDGYIAFQTAASALIRHGIEGREAPATILSRMRDAWSRSRQTRAAHSAEPRTS